MQVTWYPKRIALGALFAGSFVALLTLAVDIPARGPLAVVGGLAFVVINAVLSFIPPCGVAAFEP